MNETQSNIIDAYSASQNESDGFVGNKFHRIINFEQDDTISITSHPNENESELPFIIINLNSSEIDIEFNNIYSVTHQDLTEVEIDDITSVTMDPNKNEPGKQNLIFHLNSSEINNDINGIDDDIHQSFDKVENGKTTFISTDSNENKLANKQLHYGDKLYECEICMKTFFDSTTLARHAKTHCDDDFNTSNLYKKTPQETIISNVGDILYKCKICYKAFFDSSSLARHVRFHCNK